MCSLRCIPSYSTRTGFTTWLRCGRGLVTSIKTLPQSTSYGVAEFAGLKNDGLENDGVEQDGPSFSTPANSSHPIIHRFR